MVSTANTRNHPDYNPIFEKLVIGTSPNTKERLIGMLAYSDYKEEKYQWKEQYRSANNVDEVPAQAVRDFLLAYHNGKLEKLRNDAEETLYVFASHYAEGISKDVYKQALNDNLLKEVRSHNNSNYSAIKKSNITVASKVQNSTSDVISEMKERYDGWWVAGFKGAFGSTIFAAVALFISILFSVANPDTNFGRLVQFIIGKQEFIILHPNDCRLKSSDTECIN
ncbi:hypothetical protein P3441_22085 [Vibrio parahaemolyticus]|nr:hypothetical protein [Vibrio parahaemolyticus]MDF4452846.1 hypothetical protein [Vibrio parahaemolyticus]